MRIKHGFFFFFFSNCAFSTFFVRIKLWQIIKKSMLIYSWESANVGMPGARSLISERQKKPLKVLVILRTTWRRTTGCCPGARGFPRGPSVDGCGPKICKFICVSPMRDSSSCRGRLRLPGLPTCTRGPEDLWEPVTLSCLLLRGVITIRDHKWNLSRRVTIEQSPRARDTKASVSCPYVRIHMHPLMDPTNFSPTPSACPRYPSSFPRSAGCPGQRYPATGYRFRRASWSGTFRPASRRAFAAPIV